MRREVAAIGILGVLFLGAGAWFLLGDDPPRPEPTARRPVEEPEDDSVRATRATREGTPGEVVCEVGRALEGRKCHVRLGPPDWPMPSTLGGTYDGSRWRFRPPAPAGRADLICSGHEDPIPVRWNPAGDCKFTGLLPLPADAPLFGKVTGAADLPDGTVFLQGCGAHKDDPVDADGSFFVLASPGRCSIRAWRRAGKLKLQGPWIEAEPIAGTEVEVELSVPTFEPAGLGVRAKPLEDGIEITSVIAGSPAAAAGMEAGDVLTAIDDVPVDGMSYDEFMELGMGPAGTTVQVTGYDADGEPFDATIRREIIPPEE